MSHEDIGLVHIVPLDEIDGFLKLVIHLGGWGGLYFPLLPACKGFFDFLNHLRSLKITPDRQHHIVGIKEALMKGNQILTSDAIDGGIFCRSSVGTVWPINKLPKLPGSDSAGAVVSARNGTALPEFAQLDHLFRKGRIHQDVRQNRQTRSQVFAQHRHGGRTRAQPDSGFHRSGNELQFLIDLLTRPARGSTRAHDGSGE